MPEEISDVKPAEESSASENDVKTTADSSNAEKEGVKSLSDVVSEAAKASAEPKAPVSPTEEEEATPEEEVEKEEPDQTEDEAKAKEVELPPEGKDVPYDRFKEVVTERNDYKTKYEADAPMADTAKALTNFCQSNRITQQDLQGALELLALSKTDVKAFRAKMDEMLTGMDIAMGSKLPADLQKDVDDGVIPESRAKELALARMRLEQAEHQRQEATQRGAQAQHNAVTQALTDWENAQMKQYPEWGKYAESIQDRFQRLCMEQYPRTPQEAIRLAEQALQTVKSRFKSFIPKPPVRKVLKSTGSSTNNGQANYVLKSLDDLGDVVRMVAAKHR